jgi:hypothetical protein
VFEIAIKSSSQTEACIEDEELQILTLLAMQQAIIKAS